MKKRWDMPIFRFIKWLVWAFYPKMTVYGQENLPNEPAVIVANHTKMNGPICCELYFPGKRYTWCAGQMMHIKDVPEYAFQDFWSAKPKSIRWFYKILSYIIAPIAVCVFNNANTIGVYRDTRIISTFRNTVGKLQEGASVVVFPEHDKDYNHIICDFQDRFIDVAKLYYKKTGKEVSFVPMYIAPNLKGMYIGRPIRFSVDTPIVQERRRICEYLMKEITDIACELPRHKVVSYRNVPKKQYTYNIPSEVSLNEKAGS